MDLEVIQITKIDPNQLALAYLLKISIKITQQRLWVPTGNHPSQSQHAIVIESKEDV